MGFFARIGISNLKFKPAYNPYTEPSMEIFGFHPGLNKWIEIGNAGVFRPEMLLPMGLPGDVRVIAWGLSVERPTMLLYGISNIRELFGAKMDVQNHKVNPVAWYRDARRTDDKAAEKTSGGCPGREMTSLRLRASVFPPTVQEAFFSNQYFSTLFTL